ncbi:MAG: hypothetical protein FWG87_02060 [Defluviitaleaceae bacterium]|nr:hypothetical protein [Defluviitaleaceae bacterium]
MSHQTAPHALLAQIMQCVNGKNCFEAIPEFESHLHPWDIIRAVRHMLPPHEQRIIDAVSALPVQ